MEASKKLHRPDLFLWNRAKVVFRSPHSLSKTLGGKERATQAFLFSYTIFMYICYVKKVFSIRIMNI